MRAPLLPQFIVVNGFPSTTLTGEYTNGYDPIWQIPATLDDIAKWSFRVRTWTVTITDPVYAHGLGGASRSFEITSQFGGTDQDERFAALPTSSIDVSDGYGGEVNTLVGGSGAYYQDGDTGMIIGIGPSVATFQWCNFPTIVQATSGPLAGQLLYPVTVTLTVAIPYTPVGTTDSALYYSKLTSVGTDYDVEHPDGENHWTGSACNVTFCGLPLKMYYAGVDLEPHTYPTGFSQDWIGVSDVGTITIEPKATEGYWEYRDAEGNNPMFDLDTGELLITPPPLD